MQDLGVNKQWQQQRVLRILLFSKKLIKQVLYTAFFQSI